MAANLTAGGPMRSEPLVVRQAARTLPAATSCPTRESPKKHFCATVYNQDTSPALDFDQDKHSYMIAGNETCPTTGRQHWQVYIAYLNKVRFSTVKADFGPNFKHVEKCRGSPQKNIDYCKKDGDFIEHGVPDLVGQGKRNDLAETLQATLTMTFNELLLDEVHGPRVARAMQYFRSVYQVRAANAGQEWNDDMYASIVLRPWQTDALALVDGVEPHPRHFYWMHDSAGNTGKSWFAGLLVAKHGSLVFTSGKMADMAHVYNSHPIVIFDLARTQADKIDHVYNVIEVLKNGRLFSPKYDSMVKVFKPPHVFVFANFVPDHHGEPGQCRHDKLSADRWVVTDISS